MEPTTTAIVWKEDSIDQLDGTYASVETAQVNGVYLTWMGDRVHAINENGEEDELPCEMDHRDTVAWELIGQLRAVPC